MAKRRPKYKEQNDILQQRQALLRKVGWAIMISVALLFGISMGYRIALEDNVMQGVLTGLLYSGGALLILFAAVFVNRKLKGY